MSGAPYGFPPSQPVIWGGVLMALAMGRRDISRASYRVYHRHGRYIAAKVAESMTEMLIYGTSTTLTKADGTIEVIRR